MLSALELWLSIFGDSSFFDGATCLEQRKGAYNIVGISLVNMSTINISNHSYSVIPVHESKYNAVE